jgi:hypothetical protein
MDRKLFLKRILQTGAVCCGAAWGQALSDGQDPSPVTEGAEGARWIADLERRMITGSESPGSVKAEKAEYWIKELMDHMDDLLDRETKVRLMKECGRSCYLRAFGVAGEKRPSAEELGRYLKTLEESGYVLERKGDTVSFTFSWGRDHQNPWGLIIRDGYCMCPLVESGPPGLSPTFCYCSTGYVGETFARITGRTVEVDLVESLKTGAQDCVFRVTVLGV